MLLDNVCYSGCQGLVHEHCTSGVFMATFVQDVRLDWWESKSLSERGLPLDFFHSSVNKTCLQLSNSLYPGHNQVDTVTYVCKNSPMAMMLVNVFHHARDFEVHHLPTSCLKHESGIMGVTIQHVQQDLCNSWSWGVQLMSSLSCPWGVSENQLRRHDIKDWVNHLEYPTTPT
jgi:hypothetical protein